VLRPENMKTDIISTKGVLSSLYSCLTNKNGDLSRLKPYKISNIVLVSISFHIALYFIMNKMYFSGLISQLLSQHNNL
jgi:hypothetical protein